MSQNELILAALKRGEILNAISVDRPPYNCKRLASRITDLKNMGHTDIRDGWIKTPPGKRCKCYWKPAPSIDISRYSEEEEVKQRDLFEMMGLPKVKFPQFGEYK